MEEFIPQRNIVESSEEEKKQYSESPLWPGYVDSLESGDYRPPTKEDLSRKTENIFSTPTLTPISDREKSLLKDFVFREWVDDVDHQNSFQKRIVPYPVYRKKIDKKSDYDSDFIIYYGSESPEEIHNAGFQILTPHEKRSLLSDPETWGSKAEIKSRLDGYGSRAGSGQMSRPLFRTLKGELEPDEGFSTYSYTEEKVKAMFAEVRKRTGKETIAMLDVGGNMGLALHQAKEVDSRLETTNLTLHANPVTYAVDHLDVRPAELFPPEYLNKFDIIVSNFAFTYFMFPDIALENCIKALSVGGEARITITARRNPLARYREESDERDGNFPLVYRHSADEKDRNERMIKERLQNIRGILTSYVQSGEITLLHGELPNMEEQSSKFHAHYIIQKQKETVIK